ncbi:L-lactate dehydrogenase [Klebsiella quasipneumoniae]|nr:L-lactate dehydrogenase [Klebsiella quasipneumoniae]
MRTKTRKVMIIGTGNVGASAAYALLNQSICEELILVDLNQPRAEAHAQDLSDAAAYLPGMMTISTREASDCADVDIAVITVSGGALRPGQSRLDELTTTAKIVKSIVPTMMANGFNGIFLVATNPCDIITWQVWQLSGLPRSQVLGTGVWLDTTRLRRLLAQELNIGAQSIDAFILGEHGDTQFPVWSHSSVMARRSPTSTSNAPAGRSTGRRWPTKCASWGLRSTPAKAVRNMAWQAPSPRSAAIFLPAATARWRSPAFLTVSTGSAARRLGCRRCWPRGAWSRLSNCGWPAKNRRSSASRLR